MMKEKKYFEQNETTKIGTTPVGAGFHARPKTLEAYQNVGDGR